MKFLTPIDFKGAKFEEWYALYKSKKIGFVGISINKKTIWLPIEYDGDQQIRMLNHVPIESQRAMFRWVMDWEENLYMFAEIVAYIRQKNGELDNLKRFDSRICQNCKGICCKRTGCYYSPKDFEDKSFKGLYEHLFKGYTSIIGVHSFFTGKPNTLVLKVRNIGEPVVVDKFYGENRCILLSAKGCSLPRDKRPYGGCELIPMEDASCITGYTLRQCSEEWQPYQFMLEELYEIFYGKDIKFNGVI